MSLISNGIYSVQVFNLPVGIWPDGNSIGLPQMVLVQWRSILNDVLYQVYVNGKYAGTTVHSSQRQMIVPVPTSFSIAVRIEVFGIQPQYADMDFSYELSELFDNNRIKIVLSRNQSIPEGSTIQIYFDSGTGTIDYENPLTRIPIRVWQNWQTKAGFGMSRFGFSDFGYDSSGAIGFGKGYFGKNPFGIDADTIEWASPVLSAGIYKFAAIVLDKAGNKSNTIETESVTLIPAVKPAHALEIVSHDKQTNELILKIV